MAARLPMMLAAITLATLAQCAGAIGVVTMNQPWVRPAAAKGSTRAFIVLGSSSDTALVAVRSPMADVVMMRGGSRAEAIDVPAGRIVVMSERGPHLALHRVARRLKLGDRVPLTLTLRDPDGRTQDIEVSAEVRNRSPVDDERAGHGHKH
jgi:copper(I)-binding protein